MKGYEVKIEVDLLEDYLINSRYSERDLKYIFGSVGISKIELLPHTKVLDNYDVYGEISSEIYLDVPIDLIKSVMVVLDIDNIENQTYYLSIVDDISSLLSNYLLYIYLIDGTLDFRILARMFYKYMNNSYIGFKSTPYSVVKKIYNRWKDYIGDDNKGYIGNFNILIEKIGINMYGITEYCDVSIVPIVDIVLDIRRRLTITVGNQPLILKASI